jgi:uncharacterized protein YyaL (SSP411 family)
LCRESIRSTTVGSSAKDALSWRLNQSFLNETGPMRKAIKILAVLALTFILAGCSMQNSNDAPEESSADAGPRTVEDIKRDGNRLKGESSLYLQQHAHNPMDWYPWGDEALERAKAEDKPIFLSIGYSSCHWCHVMEHEVFEDDTVAKFMNETFICIKVDREERPDLDKVYMDAVQTITGRGGWPMSVFLTPDLKPFHGGTYFPRDHFLDLVTQISEFYNTRRPDLERQADQITSKVAGRLPNILPGAGTPMDDDFLVRAVERGMSTYDAVNGGFQQTQKFPTPVKWRFLLHEYRRRGDTELRGQIEHTLNAMQGGGIQDHVGGGFHRYTVDADWTVPHFEKMLYDNGQLSGLFIEAGVALNRPDFTATGLDVLDFLLEDMTAKDGGFYSSYDADSGGVEGSYYVWSPEDLSEAVGEKDGKILAAILGSSAEGNFEHTGKSVLTYRADLQQIAEANERTLDEVSGLLAKHRKQLSKVRNKRTPPGLDRKVVTSWNGLTIASMAQGYAVTNDDKYLKGAKKAADYLLRKHLRDDGSLWRASNLGELSGDGVLDDYAFFCDGLLEIYQVSGETKYLVAARELMDHARTDFRREGSGYYLSSSQADSPLGRTVDFYDSVIPSGNAVMFRVLLKLAAITGETEYLNEARTGLEGWSGMLDRGGLELAGWLDAAACLVSPYYDVVIAGDKKESEEMRRAFLSRLPASAVLSLVPAKGASKDLLAVAPALANKEAMDDKATAYVCEFGICRTPTNDPAVMMTQLLNGWKK